jgi:hypothetical protein
MAIGQCRPWSHFEDLFPTPSEWGGGAERSGAESEEAGYGGLIRVQSHLVGEGTN